MQKGTSNIWHSGWNIARTQQILAFSVITINGLYYTARQDWQDSSFFEGKPVLGLWDPII